MTRPVDFLTNYSAKKIDIRYHRREAGGNNKGAGFRSRVLTLTPAAHCSLSPCSLLF